MNDLLTEVFGVRVTYGLAAGGIAALTMLLFLVLWLTTQRRKTEGPIPFGGWMNAVGFGLLPALTVWKAFESFSPLRGGAAVFEPLPLIPWLTEEGAFCPCRIEFAAGALCFLFVFLWLITRKEPLPDNGDLLMTSLVLWAGVRIVTELFREGDSAVTRYVCIGVILLCLLIWTVRKEQGPSGTWKSPVYWIVTLISGGLIAAMAAGFFSAGSPIADLLVTGGCVILLWSMTLSAAGDSRRALEGEE